MENNLQKKKKIILIIEDNEPLRQILKDKLENSDFKVFAVGTGERGISLIKKEKLDLIILDLMLPKMSGEQVLKKMNETGLIKKIPVLVLSVKGDDANINNCIKNLGASGYLTKSDYTLKGIVSKIKKILNK